MERELWVGLLDYHNTMQIKLFNQSYMVKKQDVGMCLVPDSAEVWNKIISRTFIVSLKENSLKQYK